MLSSVARTAPDINFFGKYLESKYQMEFHSMKVSNQTSLGYTKEILILVFVPTSYGFPHYAHYINCPS